MIFSFLLVLARLGVACPSFLSLFLVSSFQCLLSLLDVAVDFFPPSGSGWGRSFLRYYCFGLVRGPSSLVGDSEAADRFSFCSFFFPHDRFVPTLYDGGSFFIFFRAERRGLCYRLFPPLVNMIPQILVPSDFRWLISFVQSFRTGKF